MQSEFRTTPEARYAMTWRGLNRSHTRDMLIGGEEWIFIDLRTKDVVGVFREFTRAWEKGIYRLNAGRCYERRRSSRDLVTFIVPRIFREFLEPIE